MQKKTLKKRSKCSEKSFMLGFIVKARETGPVGVGRAGYKAAYFQAD